MTDGSIKELNNKYIMKNLILFISVLLFFSCKEANIKKTYTGIIGNKFKITMHLESNKGNLTGLYFYDKNAKPLKLEGSISENGTILLNEYNNEKRTGVIKGQMINDKISGVWKNPDNGKKLDFFVETSLEDYNKLFVNKENEIKEKYKNQIKDDIYSGNGKKHIKHGVTYNYKMIGGINNAKIIVRNTTPYDFTNIYFFSTYYRTNGEIYKSVENELPLLKAGDFKTIYLPDTNKGTKLVTQMLACKSKEIDLNFSFRGGGKAY